MKKYHKCLMILIIFFISACDRKNASWQKSECHDNSYSWIYNSGAVYWEVRFNCRNNNISYAEKKYNGSTILKMFFYESGKLESVDYFNDKMHTTNSIFYFCRGTLDTTKSMFIKTNYNPRDKMLFAKSFTHLPYDSVVACKFGGSVASAYSFDSVYFNKQRFYGSLSDTLAIPLSENDFLNDSLTILFYNYTTTSDSSVKYQVMPHWLQFKRGDEYYMKTNKGVIK